jgi:membrane-anchored glycerophosphoryl diester phosphodiesterase (GDPDase)
MSAPEARLFRSYGHGWTQFTKYFLHIFLVGLIAAVASSPTWFQGWGGGITTGGTVILTIFLAAYSLLVLPVIEYGASRIYLKYMRDDEADIREVVDGFKTNYLNIVLANLLVFAIVGIGVFLLIVPGIVFACRLSFVPYLVMDKGMDPVAAIEKSWTMTRGHGFRIFAMYLLAILLFIVGFCLLIVGAFFSSLWVSCAFASLYYAVDTKEQALLNENGKA